MLLVTLKEQAIIGCNWNQQSADKFQMQPIARKKEELREFGLCNIGGIWSLPIAKKEECQQWENLVFANC